VSDETRIIRDELRAFDRLRLCREHSDLSGAECDVLEMLWDCSRREIRAACDRIDNDPRDGQIRDLEAQVTRANSAAAKSREQVSGLKERLDVATTRATNLEALCGELQAKNMSRPEVQEVASLVSALWVGLRTINYVADPDDMNRQLLCGMMITCQEAFRSCGAVADVRIDAIDLISKYYASLPQRDIDSLKSEGLFHLVEVSP